MDTSSGSDRLTSIAGIGPKLERALNGQGITTFDALASASTTELLALLTGRPFVTEERLRAWQTEARRLAGQRAEPGNDVPPRTVRHTFSLAVTVEVGSQRILMGSAQHLGSGDETRWVGWDRTSLEGFVRERIGATVPATDAADPADVAVHGAVGADAAVDEAEAVPADLVPVRFTVLSLEASAPLPVGPAIIDLTIGSAALELPPGTAAYAEATIYARLASGDKVEAGTMTGRPGLAGPTNLAVAVTGSPEWVGLDALVTFCANEAVGPLRAVSADQATMLVRSS